MIAQSLTALRNAFCEKGDAWMRWDLGMMTTAGDAGAVQSLVACNETSAAYGLQLTAAQAQALLDSWRQTLRRTGRIEFGGGVLEQMIRLFCDSPYLHQDNYEETLHELVALFYQFKNETEDRVGDRALLQYMKDAFDGTCRGSLELLGGMVLPEMARRLRLRCAPPAMEQKVSDD